MTNRKHHVKDKQITTLSGWFHSPLRVGERAIISGVNCAKAPFSLVKGK